MKIASKFSLAALLFASVAVANASNIYNNPASANSYGDCSFNTTCAAAVGRGDDFALQQFTVGSTVTVASATYTTVLYGSNLGTSVNYAFYGDSGLGTPGSVVASGSSSFASITSFYDPNVGPEETYAFNVTPLSLTPGTYYFAIQEVTTEFSDYLYGGASSTGGFETMDGGLTFSSGYEGLESITVSLDSTAYSTSATPEPGAIYLLGSGLAGVAALRRRMAKK